MAAKSSKKNQSPLPPKITSEGLAKACLDKKAPDVAEILAKAPHLGSLVDATGSSMFFSAARMGNAECLALFLPFSDPLFQSSDGSTALMHAAMASNIECMALLLPLSDANARTHHGWTALMRCIANGDEPGVDLLLPVTELSFQGRYLGQLLSAATLSRHSNILGASMVEDERQKRQRIAEKVQAKECEIESGLLLSSCSPCASSMAKGPRL